MGSLRSLEGLTALWGIHWNGELFRTLIPWILTCQSWGGISFLSPTGHPFSVHCGPSGTGQPEPRLSHRLGGKSAWVDSTSVLPPYGVYPMPRVLLPLRFVMKEDKMVGVASEPVGHGLWNASL